MNDFDNIYDDQLLQDIGGAIGPTTSLRRQPDVVANTFVSSPVQQKVSLPSPGTHSPSPRGLAKNHEVKYSADKAGWSIGKQVKRGPKTMQKSLTTEVKFAVHFRVHYASNFGEEVCVVGGLPDLGDWKGHKHMLKWTEGNIWVSVKPLITNQRHFCYKYRVLEENEVRHWEDGIDRICHPELLPEGASSPASATATGPGSGIAYNTGYKNVLANDQWQ